jgi:hypothetical protein
MLVFLQPVVAPMFMTGFVAVGSGLQPERSDSSCLGQFGLTAECFLAQAAASVSISLA